MVLDTREDESYHVRVNPLQIRMSKENIALLETARLDDQGYRIHVLAH